MDDISDSGSSDTDDEISEDSLIISSDEELFADLERSRTKNENFIEVIVPPLNDREFLKHFRVSKRVSEIISERFNHPQYFNYQSGGNGTLDSYKQVLIYLWFVGHQTSSFRGVADSNLEIDVTTWPLNERIEIEAHFSRNGFPGTIGAIDESHVKIDKPKNDPDSYLNRKHFFSIQCVTTDIKSDIFVGFPGSVHDSRVFRASSLSDTLPQKCGRYFILGDSGYPCVCNLLTPFKNLGHLNRRQQNYHVKLAKKRYLVELCIGMLKQKFRQLFHVKLKSIPDITHFIRACCVLHNLALDDDFPYEANEMIHPRGALIFNPERDIEQADDRNGMERRHAISNMLPLY